MTSAVEEPLRRELERRVNASLTGYTATIGRADLHPIGLGLTLHDVTVVQNELPNPPVIYIPRWATSVEWRALLSGALVANVTFTHPAFYVTVQQAEQEAAEPTPATDHGWQDAVTAVYPLKIDRFRVDDGMLFYYDTGGIAPVHLKRFALRAENIRNVRSVPGKYPSPLELEATLADGARFRFGGRADFLATPHATVRGTMRLRALTLTALRPGFRHLDLAVNGGTLDAAGRVEYTPKQLRLGLDRATLEGARIDYVRRNVESGRRVEKVARAATTSETEPATRLDVREAIVRGGTFGFLERGAKPYYVYLDRTEARVTGFSNAREARRGSASLRGRLMGTGPLRVQTEFTAGGARPDFEAEVQADDVDLPALNDLLRAEADVDVTAGRLSVYSELAVRKGRVDGYVKPLFSDIDVYDREQDRGKSPAHQAYEAMVGAASTVLTNRAREEVATITSLSGPVESPSSSTWDVVAGLLRNAFVKAILPGLEPRRRPAE